MGEDMEPSEVESKVGQPNIPVPGLEAVLEKSKMTSSNPECIGCGSRDYMKAVYDVKSGKGPYCSNMCRATDNEEREKKPAEIPKAV
jgi:hypothetical protein